MKVTVKKPFVLTTIRFSHFNEKARWALDRFEVPYRENGLMPVMHFIPAMLASRGLGRSDKFSTRFSTPILNTDDGKTICDSSQIVRYVSDRFSTPDTTLYPNAEAAELEALFSSEIAPHARRAAYFNALPNRKLVFKLADQNVGPVQAALFKVGFPFARRTIMKGLNIHPKSVERSREVMLKQWALVEKRLSDGRAYLTGDKFTAADLALACAATPALLIRYDEGFAGYLPPVSDLDPSVQKFVAELRDSTVGRFILRMYANERGKRVIPFGKRA